MLDRKTFSVPVTCPVYRGLVTITYATLIGEQEIKTFHWQCPYVGCTGRGTFRLHGEFVGTSVGIPSYFGKNRML